MKKAEDYRMHAAECRRLALQSPDHAARDAPLNMAETWDSLAVDREIDVARQECIRALEMESADRQKAGG